MNDRNQCMVAQSKILPAPHRKSSKKAIPAGSPWWQTPEHASVTLALSVEELAQVGHPCHHLQMLGWRLPRCCAEPACAAAHAQGQRLCSKSTCSGESGCWVKSDRTWQKAEINIGFDKALLRDDSTDALQAGSKHHALATNFALSTSSIYRIPLFSVCQNFPCLNSIPDVLARDRATYLLGEHRCKCSEHKDHPLAALYMLLASATHTACDDHTITP